MAVIYPPKEYVRKLQQVLISRKNLFAIFPTYIENVIKEKMWAEVEDEDGNSFTSFKAFVETPLPEGLGLTISDLYMYLKKAPKAREGVYDLAVKELDEDEPTTKDEEAFDQVKGMVLGEVDEQKKVGVPIGTVNNPKGENQHTKEVNSDNISINQDKKEKSKKKRSKKHGTDPEYLASRVKAKDPELFDKVTSGEMTPNEAAIKAGIRKPYAQFRTDDIEKAIKTILKHYSWEDLEQAHAERCS